MTGIQYPSREHENADKAAQDTLSPGSPADWQTDMATQVRWCRKYIAGRYGRHAADGAESEVEKRAGR